MLSIKKAEIDGNMTHVERIKAVFSEVYFEGNPNSKISLTLTTVFSNFYRNSSPDQKNGDLLYVVVPSEDITSVWSGKDIEETRLGIAKASGKSITRAIAFHKGNETLYLCLENSGMLIDAIVGPDGLGI